MPYPGSEAIDPCLAETEICEGSEASFSGVRIEAALRSTSAAWLQHFSTENGCTYLNWPGLFEFLISRDGRRIEGRPSGTGSWEAFQTYLLGQVLSFALIKQGIEPLHGTVMVVSGMAVGIIGDCGYGK